ncbi:MAG: hypothetical protein ACI9V0_002921 [Parasphingorhabdus sp.]|jgi:hypothetical protein
MKYRYHAAYAAFAMAALMATPATAQNVSGSVAVHGTVAPRCGSTFAGSTSFSGTINLGELSQSNGTISPTLAGSTTNSPAGVADFLVGCSTNSFNVTISATRFINPAFPSTPPGSSIIDYTAEAKIALSEGGFALVNYTTAAVLPAATVQTINDFVSTAPGNFQVRVFAFHPDNGDAAVLLSGAYDAVITILVAPAL